MEYITLPSTLVGFSNTHTETVTTVSGLGAYLLHGNVDRDEKDSLCPHCKKPMHIHNTYEVNLRHLCIGGNLSNLRFPKVRFFCPACKQTKMQEVPFQAEGHRITTALFTYARDLLAYGFTNKAVTYLTKLGKNTVKDIDMQRLREKYTIDGKRLIKPERQARYLVACKV